MNRLFIFMLIIFLTSNVHGVENPSITLIRNSSGSLTFKVSLKTSGEIKIDWGNNNIKTYDVNASTRADEATMIVEDVKRNTEIKIYGDNITLFICTDQFVSSLNVKNAKELMTLSCTRNYLKEIDLSNNKALRSFNCNDNRIKTLNLSNNTRITYLNCSYNYIRNISLDKNIALSQLHVTDNHIKNLNLSKNKNLKLLYAGGNKLSAIEAKDIAVIQHLDISYNKFSPCGLNQLFTDLPAKEKEEKSEKKNLIISNNKGFLRSNTAIAVAKNWMPDVDGNGNAECE